MVGRRVALWGLLALAMLPATAQAAPADLDRAFGGDGILRVEGPSGSTFPSESVAQMAIGPGDEVFVLLTGARRCAAQFDCEIDLSVLRYDRDGNPDRSFGVGPGSLLTVRGSGLEPSVDLAVGADGKPVVVAGGQLARFDGLGHLDATFGTGGQAPKVERELGGTPVVAVQADGRVLVVGEGGREETGSNLRLRRYLSNGAPDPGFGGDGEVELTLGSRSRPVGVMLGPAGTISVAAPQCCGGTRLFGEGFSLARFLADGQPDPGFDADGQLLFSTPGHQATVEAAAMAPDGSTFLVFEEETPERATTDNMVKLRPDGTVDTSFGVGGRLHLYSRNGVVRAVDLAIDPRGRIVGVAADGNVQLFRLLPDGSLDRTFNAGQPVSAMIAKAREIAVEVGLQSSGRIVALGETSCCTRELFGLIALRGGTDGTRCQGRKATIVGTRGRDELTGTPRRDVIAALGGRDEVRGLAGADLICGGKGRDRLFGGAGRDSVRP